MDAEQIAGLGLGPWRTMRFSDLPEDMQVLILDLWDDCCAQVSRDTIASLTFAVRLVPISRFPEVPICTNDRSRSYAEAMIGEDLPPVLVCNLCWIDGRHRVWAYRRSGADYVRTIDLYELIGNYQFPPIAYLSRE